MKARLLWMVLTGLFLAADGKPAADLEAIRGDWKVVGLEIDGKELPLPADSKLKMVFGHDTMRLDDGVREMDKQLAFKYALDPATTPKIIDLTGTNDQFKDETLEGIYQLQGDKLVLCLQLPKGVKQRPSEFATREGSMLVILRLERVKS
jgi:uncharacterized protein (TIGR03067 family)